MIVRRVSRRWVYGLSAVLLGVALLVWIVNWRVMDTSVQVFDTQNTMFMFSRNQVAVCDAGLMLLLDTKTTPIFDHRTSFIAQPAHATDVRRGQRLRIAVSPGSYVFTSPLQVWPRRIEIESDGDPQTLDCHPNELHPP